jgi:ubiquitin C-terminal hydrolase
VAAAARITQQLQPDAVDKLADALGAAHISGDADSAVLKPLHPLPAAPPTSLLWCLNQFVAAEVLEQYRCAVCVARAAADAGADTASGPPAAVSERLVASKRMYVRAPPAVLTLHLKRFVQTTKGIRKLSQHIAFPGEVDLAPYCDLPADCALPTRYRLCGVIGPFVWFCAAMWPGKLTCV